MAVSRSTRVIEWLLVAAIIGVILALTAIFYGRMAEDVRRLSFETTAEHFRVGVTAVRVYTYVYRDTEELERGIELYAALPGGPQRADTEAPTRVFINQHGWPAASDPVRAQEPSVEACVQLWYALLHRSPRAVTEGAARGEYQVSLTGQGLCRYRPQGLRQPQAHFTYSPVTGAVTLMSGDE